MTAEESAILRYGRIEGGYWANEAMWMCLLPIDPEIAQVWKNALTGCPTERIYANRDMCGPLTRALANVKRRGLLSQLKTFDGCFAIRDMRGVSGLLSSHSWGGAIDINAKDNELGTNGQMTPDFIRCFTDEAFTWGGAFLRKDPMHYSFLKF